MCGTDIDIGTFKDIFRDHWDTFKATYPRFDTPDYDSAVQKMLDCGDPEKMGYVQYRCLWCGEWRRIGFTCKSSFCLRCAQPRTSQWADFIGRRLLPGVTYRHFILTTPDFLAGLAVTALAGLGAPIVVCNESHRFMVAEQLRESGAAPQAIVLEPVGRNTAPAVAVAALVALETSRSGATGDRAAAGACDMDPVLLVLPADHVIRDVGAFQSAVMAGRAAADAGGLVTSGVEPDRPETGYGYIRRVPGEGPAYPVAEFVEKPDAATAAKYVASGDYFWNSGMFMFRGRAYLGELKKHAPATLSACEDAVAAAKRDLDFTRLPAAEFGACPSDSIEYAVMEKTG